MQDLQGENMKEKTENSTVVSQSIDRYDQVQQQVMRDVAKVNKRLEKLKPLIKEKRKELKQLEDENSFLLEEYFMIQIRGARAKESA